VTSDYEFLSLLTAGLAACDVHDQRVLVAVSGGADSVALLRGLTAIAGNDARDRLVVAHVDHQLRGDQSAADARWVQSLASGPGLPCIVHQADVAARASERGESIELAARNARYELLTETAREAGCPAVALAHTSDDQVETILHRILRGTGPRGLSGMPVSRPLADGIRLVRPMLNVSREQVEAWLLEIGQEFRTDPSNAGLDHTRNRLRNVLLPRLEAEFNPQVRRALLTLGQQASEVSAWLTAQAEDLAGRVLVQAGPDVLRIDCGPIEGQPMVLVRETLNVVWSRAGWPLGGMSFRDWERLAGLVLGVGTAETLPGGVDARRRAGLLVLRRGANTGGN